MSDDPRLLAFARLVAIVDRLRGPGGCPWDRSLEPERAAAHLVEEAHEAHAAAVGSPGELAAELGDVLMNVLLLARIGQDAGEFSLREVSERVAEKLVRRHPHVFGGAEASDAAEAIRSWEGIKREERRRAGGGSALDGVPRRMPALVRAQRVGEKAAQAGFDWADPSGALEKLCEEARELAEALASGRRSAVREEIGDALFSLVNVARKAGVDAESALLETTRRFEWRFRYLEARLGARLQTAAEREPDEMERAWREAKRVLDEAELGLPADLEEPLRGIARDWLAERRLALATFSRLPADSREGEAGRTVREVEEAERCFLLSLSERLASSPLERGDERGTMNPQALLAALADPGARDLAPSVAPEIERLRDLWARAGRRIAEGSS